MGRPLLFVIQVVLQIFVLQNFVLEINGHGRMIDPPSRSTMWRFGFNTPPNYDDNALYCGGASNQYGRNGGKCGVCGDPWQGPYDNEAGGKYGNGIIVRNYKQGSEVEMTIHISANHVGFFELKLCPNNNPTVRITHDCLNKYPLTILNGNGTRFYPGTSVGNHLLNVLLPSDVTCTQCVIQWRYHAGNSWGVDPDGRGCMGCGNQEEFYNCADVSIAPSEDSESDTPEDRSDSSDGNNNDDIDDVEPSLPFVHPTVFTRTRQEERWTSSPPQIRTSPDDGGGENGWRWLRWFNVDDKSAEIDTPVVDGNQPPEKDANTIGIHNGARENDNIGLHAPASPEKVRKMAKNVNILFSILKNRKVQPDPRLKTNRNAVSRKPVIQTKTSTRFVSMLQRPIPPLFKQQSAAPTQRRRPAQIEQVLQLQSKHLSTRRPGISTKPSIKIQNRVSLTKSPKVSSSNQGTTRLQPSASPQLQSTGQTSGGSRDPLVVTTMLAKMKDVVFKGFGSIAGSHNQSMANKGISLIDVMSLFMGDIARGIGGYWYYPQLKALCFKPCEVGRCMPCTFLKQTVNDETVMYVKSQT